MQTHMAESGEEATVAQQPHSGTPATIVRMADTLVSAQSCQMQKRALRSENEAAERYVCLDRLGVAGVLPANGSAAGEVGGPEEVMCYSNNSAQ
jgi:hypothetical protein